MRFIINFFLYGLLFYLIYLFFPDAFHTLVAWADKTYEFLRSVVMQASDKIHSSRGLANSYLDFHLTALFSFWTF